MSPRPSATSRTTGCFLVVFFSAFALFPMFGFFGLFFGDTKVNGSITGAVVVLLVFFLIGMLGLVFGIRTLMGKGKIATGAPKQTTVGSALPPAIAPQPMANGYYRLKPESSHRAGFIMLLLAALFWNGITWTFVVGSLSGKSDNDAPTWFLLIFVAIGMLILFVAVKAFLRWIMVGETHLDVSTTAATPGQVIELLVSQPGKFPIDRLTMDFICREKATYRAGTDTHTKTELVREAPVCDHETLNARDGKVLTHQSAVVPDDAMLSFKASNNEITWLVRVKMVLPGRPDVEQCYPIRVVSPEILKLEKAHG